MKISKQDEQLLQLMAYIIAMKQIATNVFPLTQHKLLIEAGVKSTLELVSDANFINCDILKRTLDELLHFAELVAINIKEPFLQGNKLHLLGNAYVKGDYSHQLSILLKANIEGELADEIALKSLLKKSSIVLSKLANCIWRIAFYHTFYINYCYGDDRKPINEASSHDNTELHKAQFAELYSMKDAFFELLGEFECINPAYFKAVDLQPEDKLDMLRAEFKLCSNYDGMPNPQGDYEKLEQWSLTLADKEHDYSSNMLDCIFDHMPKQMANQLIMNITESLNYRHNRHNQGVRLLVDLIQLHYELG